MADGMQESQSASTAPGMKMPGISAETQGPRPAGRGDTGSCRTHLFEGPPSTYQPEDVSGHGSLKKIRMQREGCGMSGSRGLLCLPGAGAPLLTRGVGQAPSNYQLKQDVSSVGQEHLGRNVRKMPFDGTLVVGFLPRVLGPTVPPGPSDGVQFGHIVNGARAWPGKHGELRLNPRSPETKL